MWELIRANKRKSAVLYAALWICLILTGYIIGQVYLFPPDGGFIGMFLAVILSLFLTIISYIFADSIILAVSKAKKITHEDHPELFNVVEEMKIASGLPAMPDIYIIPEIAPNAFATGLKPESSSVAITAGLLTKLNRDELQGVVAHEMSHILNRDVQFVTLAGVLLGSITLISELFLRNLFFASSSRRYDSKSREGNGNSILLIIGIIFAILAPIMARLLYFALSRKREYLADATAVRLTRYPEGLAGALEKISQSTENLSCANKVTAPMYIVNPLKEKGMKLSDLTSTHPPITERINILRRMSIGVNYVNYQEAFSDVKGISSKIIPASGLKETNIISIREPFFEKQKEGSRGNDIRKTGNLIMSINKYTFLTCICGLKIKTPPDFRKQTISCPRCGRELNIKKKEIKNGNAE
ncbi:MAG: M48 family metallopeptidase [Candidatus Firestonebacteria bacterium]|nr:M48 family metallopeptidase [Candidatus Firestonebacteria bacterium]